MELPLDHVAIAVPSITAVLSIFESLTSGTATPIEAVPSQRVNVAFVGSGAGRIELIEPASSDSTIQKFLDRKGTGLHHVAYRVPDLAAALRHYSAAGYRLIDEQGRPGAGGHLVAFLHPQSTGGVLIELVEG